MQEDWKISLSPKKVESGSQINPASTCHLQLPQTRASKGRSVTDVREMQGANKAKSNSFFLLQSLKVKGENVQHFAWCPFIVPLLFKSLPFSLRLMSPAERKGCFYSHNHQLLCCNRKALIHRRSIPYRNWGDTVYSPYFSNQIDVSASTYLVSQTQKVSITYITVSDDKKVSHYLPYPHFLKDQYSWARLLHTSIRRQI